MTHVVAQFVVSTRLHEITRAKLSHYDDRGMCEVHSSNLVNSERGIKLKTPKEKNLLTRLLTTLKEQQLRTLSISAWHPSHY